MDQPKIKPRIFPKIFWSLLIIFLIVFGLLIAKAYSVSTKIFGSKVSFFQRLTQLTFNSSGTPLQGESQGQINILLLGYGGPGHDGPFLTDSMILASIKPATKQILLTSIPRDYWIASNGSGEKINQFFADGIITGGGSDKNPNYNGGGALAEQAVGQISGETVPYYASLDFQGFVDAINRVGGVDVNVDTTFTDYQYPNDATNGYLPPQTFTAGPQHMDGDRALIFARSRHAAGSEGSDFARSKRQEKIIAAFKQKLDSQNILAQPSTLNDLLNILADHFHTNIEPNELIHLAGLLKSNSYQVISQSLDETSGLICQQLMPATGEFILDPCSNITSAQVQNFFQNGFTEAGVAAEQASVILENAGTNNQLYLTIKQDLQQANVNVYEIPYRGIPLTTSVLYEINSKPVTEKFIEQTLGITSQPKPSEMVAHADLVLFVGGTQ